MARKRCSAARAVRHYLVALIQKTFFINLLQRPPLRFDIVVVIGDIRIVHIRPEAHDIREFPPHALVLPHGFLAFFDKRLNAVLFNLFLSVEAKLLLHLDLHRQAVRIPSGLSRNILAFHGMVAGNGILDDTSQHMPDMRFTVCRRRSVIEHIHRRAFPLLYALLKNAVFLPELYGFLFPIHKVHVCVYFFIHTLAPGYTG